MLFIGTPAPAFTLFSSDKKQLALSSLRGQNVLLLFFPAAFTSVCTAELCSVRDGLERYEKLNVQVLGISVDSVFTLARYKEEQGLNFPLLSDFNKAVSQAYNCLYESFVFDMKGVSKRAAFLVNRDGLISYAEVLEDAGKQPDFSAIERALAEIEERS